MKILIGLFFLFFSLGRVVAATPEFPVIPGATEGYLPNGIKYYTLSTPWIKGKMALGMVVNCGSLYETREEVGVAHFLEHLCAVSVPGFDRARSLEIVHQGGLYLFNDWQAFTGETRTIYSYIYPEENSDTEKDLVSYMRGVLSDMHFLKEEVETERAVILKEMQTSYTSTLPNLYGGYFENHSIVGDSAQVCAITPEKVNGFYRKWYRPENIALVMFGNLPAEELQARLKKAFGDVRCAVDSVLPPAFLPINQSNVQLYSPTENKGNGRTIGARLIYRFPLMDMTRKSEFRQAIAMEMVTFLLKGMLEGNGKDGFKVSAAIPSNMPRASVLNVNMTCRDSADFRQKLERIGCAISHLRYGEVDKDFLRQLWKERSSVYKRMVLIPEYESLRSLFSEMYGRFCAHLPLADPKLFAMAMDEAFEEITVADIQRAADCIFTGSRSFLAGFPDYGQGYKESMVAFFDTCCARPDARVALKIPETRRVMAKGGGEKELLRVDKPVYRAKSVKKELLSNGMVRYHLSNGIELVWNKMDRGNQLLVHTGCGLAGLDSTEKRFLACLNEIRFPQITGIDEKVLEQKNRAWGAPNFKLNIGAYQTTIDVEWSKQKEEYIWQYLSSIYTSTGVDEYTYNKEAKRFVEAEKKKNTGERQVVVLSKDEVNERINRLLVPAQTRFYLQGEADIELAIAYLGAIPAKKKLKIEKEKIEVLTEDVVNRPDKIQGNTYLVNRVYKEPVKTITLKRYLLHGMLEEYMSRMLLVVIRNEKGMIYTWGTTPFYEMKPEPHTSLSLRFRIVPELLDCSLEELEKLCIRVRDEGVDEYKLKGLKRREWNRYLDLINEPKEALSFVARQFAWCGKVWDEKEVRECLAEIKLDEVNAYFKRYLSYPAEVTIR